MNALIDLEKCREYMTITIGGKDHMVKLSGTFEEPYFCGKDVCDVLGYKNTKDVLFKHVKPKFKKKLLNLNHEKVACEIDNTSLGSFNHNISYNEGKAVYISEPGLYSLIMHSNTPLAEEFRDMVYETILPSIRKYGSYQAESRLSLAMEQLAIKDKEVQEAEEKALKAEENAMVELEARQKAELKAQRVNKFMRRSTIKERKLEWIYIATTRRYHKERIYKPGSTDKITKRICGYGTGHPNKDKYFYVWIKKVYNSKDLDNHIQKMLHLFKYKEKSNDSTRHELVHGIKLSDLIAIVDFISENYDASVDYVNNFIKTRLDQSLDEEDPEAVPLDVSNRKMMFDIGDYTETIDLENEELDSVRDTFDDVLTSLKEQQENSGQPVVVYRKDLISRLSSTTNGTKKDLWSQIKEFTGWTSSKDELDDGHFKYKIIY